MSQPPSTSVSVFRLILSYILDNKIMAGVALYFGVSVLLNLLTSIDILIPCLWKTLFHVNCPGCGLTTSFMQLLTLDFPGAFDTNPLIFLVLPLGIFFLSRDLFNHKKKLETAI